MSDNKLEEFDVDKKPNNAIGWSNAEEQAGKDDELNADGDENGTVTNANGQQQQQQRKGTRNGLLPFTLKKDLKGFPKNLQTFIMLTCRGRTVNLDRIREHLEKEGVHAKVFEEHPRIVNAFFLRRGNEDREGDTKFCEVYNCGQCTRTDCPRSHSCAWCRKEGHPFVKCPKHKEMARERAKRAATITDEKIEAIYNLLKTKHGLGLGFRVDL